MNNKTLIKIIAKLKEELSGVQKFMLENDYKGLIEKAINRFKERLNYNIGEEEVNIISKKIIYCQIIRALCDKEDDKNCTIIQDILSKAESVIVDNNTKIEDINLKYYDDDKKIFLYEQISDYSNNNKLITFFKLYNLKNNLNELKKEFVGFPDNEEKLPEYYLFLKEKTKSDNLFYKCKIDSFQTIESIKSNIGKKTTIKSYIENKKTEIKVKDDEIKKIFDNLLNGSVSMQFKNVKNKEQFPEINRVYRNLKTKFSKIENYYEGKYTYGLSLLNNRLCFYDFGNREIIMNILSNPINIKRVKYDDVFDSEIEASISIKDDSSSSLSIPENNDDKIILKSNYLKGINFENNLNLLMDKLFTNNNLIYLPRYIFPISSNNRDNNNNYRSLMKNMFNYFIELDKGILNISNNDVESNNLPILPYIIDKTILFRENKFTIDENKKFIIKKKSINLFEAKLSVPPKINIDINSNLDESEKKNEYIKSIDYVLFNLINKINYYKDLVKNEFILNKDDIDKYSIHLFLIYNNKPVENIEGIFQERIKLLKGNSLLPYEGFYLTSIYFGPNLDFVNYQLLGEEMKNVKDILISEVSNLDLSLSALNNKVDKIKNEFNNANMIKLKELENEKEKLKQKDKELKQKDEELKIEKKK